MDKVNINANGVVEMLTHCISTFTKVDDNGCNYNAGVDSDDSTLGNTRKPIAPRQKINARERYRTVKYVNNIVLL